MWIVTYNIFGVPLVKFLRHSGWSNIIVGYFFYRGILIVSSDNNKNK